MSIIIDPEFQSLIPPLSKDEYTQLEKNIVKDGIRDALIVWPQGNGNSILIDGHNRFQISASHAGIRFEVREKNFKDRDEARRWIILNQFGRRNLSAYDRSILALKLKPMIAEKAKEKQSEAGGAVHQKSDKAEVNTKKELAKVAGVSHDTIHKVEVIETKATPQTKQQVRSGEKSINQAWLEIKEKERKQADLSAKAHLEAAKERHEDFQNSKTVSIQDIAQDKSDKEEISMQTKRGILNELSHVSRLFLLVNSKELDVSVLSDDDRGKVTYELLDAKGKLLRILSEVAGD